MIKRTLILGVSAVAMTVASAAHEGHAGGINDWLNNYSFKGPFARQVDLNQAALIERGEDGFKNRFNTTIHNGPTNIEHQDNTFAIGNQIAVECNNSDCSHLVEAKQKNEDSSQAAQTNKVENSGEGSGSDDNEINIHGVGQYGEGGPY